MTTTTSTRYGVFIDIEGSLDDVRPRVEELLKGEGFGILTEIDVKATIKTKLDLDVPAQVILGACNPPLAHRALSNELDVGLLLPCNVTLRDTEEGTTRVGFLDIEAMVSMVDNPVMDEVAADVSARFQRIRAALA
ncbi:hypothetical protein MNBD_ACTINO02-1117 [hydrothermal vent metagenome]|uniref:DUF302 domain-containing protein n=1 Tax=hydrothermal vent metagenome TaxID=652676 RepID=A0A3B0T087_9ZZZZ